jgi:hypothetical protein
MFVGPEAAGNQVAIVFDGVEPQNSNNIVVTINDNGTTFSNLATNSENGKTDLPLHTGQHRGEAVRRGYGGQHQ